VLLYRPLIVLLNLPDLEFGVLWTLMDPGSTHLPSFGLLKSREDLAGIRIHNDDLVGGPKSINGTRQNRGKPYFGWL